MTRRTQQVNRTARLIGFGSALLVVAAYTLGGLDWLERRALDLRFAWCNAAPQDPRIRCVDIDDASLRTAGRWPWARDAQAAFLSIAREVGARRVLVDITYNEPQTVRDIVPSDADLFCDLSELLTLPLGRTLPDEELRAAIAENGAVHLAVHYEPTAWERSARFAEVVDALRAAPLTVEQIARAYRRTPDQARRLLAAARLVLALEQSPEATDEELGAALGDAGGFLRELFNGAQQFALRRHVRRVLDESPALQSAPPRELIEAVYERLHAKAPLENETPLRQALELAIRDVLGAAATTRNPLVPAERAGPIAASADAIVPVCFPLAEAAERCGFVLFEPDPDGVMRRTNLVAVSGEGEVLTQLAFGVACAELGVGPDEIEIAPRRLTLRPPGGEPIQIQLDRQGRTVVPWVAEPDWARQFGPRVPADAFWEVYDRRRALDQNLRRARAERRDVFGSNFFATLPGHSDYLLKWERLDAAELAVLRAKYRGSPGDRADAAAELVQIDAELAGDEQQMAAAMKAERAALPDDAEGRARADDIDFALAQVQRTAESGAAYEAANIRLQQEIADTLAELRARLEDKIVLIGYTATSLADMTPTPTHPRAPGVVAHANLLNGLLTGRMVTWLTTPWNALAALVLGSLVTMTSVVVRPRTALLMMSALMLAYVTLAAAVFYQFSLWIELAAVLVAMFASYFAIAVYLYLFVDRERRALTTALSQYTSAALARQMAEDAELCRRAETREVTAVFTDLRGFTTISERIGAERTQRVLNVCLGCFSEVMLRHEAMINKFIGDGIFAFWNPVIYPQADHALRACETAVDLMTALRELIADQSRTGGDEVFAELSLRVGVATGNAVVGPCGSEQKYDYTCIGDSVNVASRLESANKFFGTSTLISGGTWAQCGERFAVRALGGVQVKGKQQAVPVYELLGRAGMVPDASVRYARRFGKGVELFQARKWDDSRDVLAECAAQRPSDLAATLYLETIERYRASPPDEAWSGAIELTEK